MRALFIGGTGTISTEVSRLAVSRGWELYVLNRGSQTDRLRGLGGINRITADITDEALVRTRIEGMSFDVVANFVNYVPDEAERDIRLFGGRTGQYIFISSASAYHKPPADYRITEGTTLANPYWQYSRDKIACERVLFDEYAKTGFPVTVVRPSHTYSDYSIPLGLHGRNGSWQVALRMLADKPVIVHGDGSSLWTMTHSEDFARGFVGLMGNTHAIGEAVQITSDETLNWNQVYGSIGRALGVTPRLYHIASDFLAACCEDYVGSLLGDKAVSVVFDNSKLKRLVPGFSARVRFDEGVRRTVEFILANPQLQREDPAFDRWCDAVIEAHEAAIQRVKGFGL